MSQQLTGRTLSDILRENEKKNSGKTSENPKKIKRRTRRGRTGRSLSQLLKGDTEKKAKKEVNNRWTRKKTQPKIYNPTTDWELDALFAPMPGMTLRKEYDRNHGRYKKGYSNSSNVNRKEFLDDYQLVKMDKILKDAMDGVGKKKKRPRKRRKKRKKAKKSKRAKKSKKQIRKKNRRISRKRDKR
tara:strand:- start:29 stop:586 length:558 start_codon:yes stop_codon:yes gene_type:complete